MEDKKLITLLKVLVGLFYVVWTASIIGLYVLVFAKGHTDILTVFALGFAQASWIWSIALRIKDLIQLYAKKEVSNIKIFINKEEQEINE